MKSFERLHERLAQIDRETGHKGYYYRVSDALTIMICGMLCNLQSMGDIYEWAQAEPVRDFLYREFRIYKLPSRAQFYNLIGRVKSDRFQEVFIAWVQETVESGEGIRTIAIDGKTICSTEKRVSEGQGVHILSAVISENKMIVGSLPCDTKTSEPKVFRELISIIDISGAVVVADALHCKRDSAEKVIEEKGDYLFAVKDNNPRLKEDIELYIQNENVEQSTQTEKNGGRIEKRTAYATTDIEWLQNREKWKNLTSERR